MQSCQYNYFKISLIFFACLLLRLIPIRPPNIEPILGAQMPLAKVFGGRVAFIFGTLSILSYDLLTHTLGTWSIITSLTYGFIGVIGYIYFKKIKNKLIGYLSFAILGTIIFDAITGLSIGPLFFHQHLYAALVGQIPFTLLHLVGNISFGLLLSPAIEQFILKNKKLKHIKIISFGQFPIIYEES